MYGKEDGQILLSGISVKKGGYAKNLPDGGGEYTQFCQILFWQTRVSWAEKHYSYAFLVHFQAFWSILNPI